METLKTVMMVLFTKLVKKKLPIITMVTEVKDMDIMASQEKNITHTTGMMVLVEATDNQ